MDSFGPGGWIEIFDAEEQVISRMDQLKNWGYTNFIQKGKILFYFDLEVEQNVIHEYEGAINEYENTTISQIES
ncbi:MAG: hypothetical protein Q4C49_13450 [Bacillota bacterium]|nr:hypothetical protein [Bacillota bacterium]